MLQVLCLLLGLVEQNMPVQVIARKSAGKGKIVNTEKRKGEEKKKRLDFGKEKASDRPHPLGQRRLIALGVTLNSV